MELGLGLALVMAGSCYLALFPRKARLHLAPGGAAIKRTPKRKLGTPEAPVAADPRTGPPKRDRIAQFGRR